MDDPRKMFKELEPFQEELNAYLAKCKDCAEEATAALKEKTHSMTDSFEDTIMLSRGTSTFEWDPSINEKHGLEGRVLLIPVAIPKSILLSLEMKKDIFENKKGTTLDIDKQLQEMGYFLILRGVAAAIQDGEELMPKLMLKAMGSMIEQLKGLREEDDE